MQVVEDMGEEDHSDEDFDQDNKYIITDHNISKYEFEIKI